MMDPTVKCDSCGADITHTRNSVGYRLELITRRLTSGGGAVTDMWIEPELKSDCHFCRLACLRNWIDKHRTMIVQSA
jgi:hypothetical protein